MKIFSMFKLEHPHHLCNCNGNQSQKNITFSTLLFMGLRVRVWVILDLFEHTREDFQPQVLLVS